MKAQGLNQLESVWTWVGAMQVGLAATGPALLGSPTSLGRFKSFPFHEKFTPEPLKLLLRLLTTNRGNPEMALSMTSISQLPKAVLSGPLQELPNFLPLPNGKL